LQKNPAPSFAGILRGYGSQTAVTPQGLLWGEKAQKYSSGELDEVQNDAMREVTFNGTKWMAIDDSDGFRMSLARRLPDSIGGRGVGFGRYQTGTNTGTTGGTLDQWSSSTYLPWGIDDMKIRKVWFLTRPPKRYQLNGSGGDYAHYSLSEYEDTDSGAYHEVWAMPWSGDSWYSVPTDLEVRPVNKAVRFFVKAR